MVTKLVVLDFYTIVTNTTLPALKLQEARSLPAQEWLKAYAPIPNARERLASLIDLGWQVLVLDASRTAADKAYLEKWFIKHDLEIGQLELPGDLPMPATSFSAWRTRRVLALSQQLKATELIYVYANAEDVATMQRELTNARRSYGSNWIEPSLFVASSLDSGFNLASRLP